ncbi:YlqD family protein [Dehalobacter sp. TBBPA1]|uniref:YlqD family protein n=1 Tax=Dehalobacter sp. TBBPA1 TaxID=3235037 RepID=UPI0034A308B3
MSSITVFRQILIKELITEGSKSNTTKQINKEINNVMDELKKFEDNKTKALTEASLRGSDQNQLDRFRQQFENNSSSYHLQRDELLQKLEAVSQFKIGEEIVLASVEGPYELQIGQTLQEATVAEIIIKDGIVVEIRNC